MRSHCGALWRLSACRENKRQRLAALTVQSDDDRKHCQLSMQRFDDVLLDRKTHEVPTVGACGSSPRRWSVAPPPVQRSYPEGKPPGAGGSGELPGEARRKKG